MHSLVDEATLLTEKLIESYHPEKVVMFGSAARGDSHKNSDIDLLIIKKKYEKKSISHKRGV